LKGKKIFLQEKFFQKSKIFFLSFSRQYKKAREKISAPKNFKIFSNALFPFPKFFHIIAHIAKNFPIQKL